MPIFSSPSLYLEVGELTEENQMKIHIIPGNPGISMFYEEFAKELVIGEKAFVTCLSHAGHTENSSIFGRKHFYNLDDQILHQLSMLFVDMSYWEEGEKIFIGHSIGCYILEEIMFIFNRLIHIDHMQGDDDNERKDTKFYFLENDWKRLINVLKSDDILEIERTIISNWNSYRLAIPFIKRLTRNVQCIYLFPTTFGMTQSFKGKELAYLQMKIIRNFLTFLFSLIFIVTPKILIKFIIYLRHLFFGGNYTSYFVKSIVDYLATASTCSQMIHMAATEFEQVSAISPYDRHIFLQTNEFNKHHFLYSSTDEWTTPLLEHKHRNKLLKNLERKISKLGAKEKMKEMIKSTSFNQLTFNVSHSFVEHDSIGMAKIIPTLLYAK
ncbi:hypothetical protein SNEBB_005880 [Seison nebaliae]|nr:hypothetical protein SNEBB_005880 [Seison nebaliae]